MRFATQLFTAQGANGSSGAMLIKTAGDPRFMVMVTGTFGGGNVVVEVSPDGGTTWIPVSDVAAIAAAGSRFFSAWGTHLRLTLAGATTPSINAWISH